MSEEKKISRRKFVAGSLATAAAAGVAAVSLGSPKEAEAAVPTTWDATADVVVLGFGAGGGGATIAAADRGLSVLVLESMPVPGGTTRCSGGGLWVPNNNFMKANGYPDSPEEARTYMIHGNDGANDDELIEAYIQNGPGAVDFLQDKCGIKWAFNLMPACDYHPEWEGAKKFGRCITGSYNGKSNGGALMSAMYDFAVSKGAKFSLNTHAKKLIKDANGRVIGVTAYQGNKKVNVKANKGVVIATGGFEWDQKYMKNFHRGPAVASAAFNPGSGGGIYQAGDGLRMAIDAGADLRNLNESWGLLVYLKPGWEEEVASYRQNAKNYKQKTWTNIVGDWFLWRGRPGTIIVNKSGERFTNEACDYDTSVYGFYNRETYGQNQWHNFPAYIVQDSYAFGKWPIASYAPYEELPSWITKGDTLDELARKLGIDSKGLQATVAEFNQYASETPPRDPKFHRGESYFDRHACGDPAIFGTNNDDPSAVLKPLDNGPYYAAQVYPSNCGACGGARINGKAQVVGVDGNVIPGLYAAGNAAGLGGPGITYNGPGNPVGGGCIFGFIAGNAIAQG